MKIFSFTFFFCVLFTSPFSQVVNPGMVTGKNDTIKVYATRDVDNKWIPWIPIADVVVKSERIFTTPDGRYQYDRLKYNVLKVLPYAKFARKRYEKLNQDLTLTANKKEQRQLVRQCDKEIKDMFNREIKNMTIYQGEILIKLIDRETGKSTYDLVRELRGGVVAFAYQSVAGVVGHNLKHQYNPQEERDIEAIIESAGYNNPSFYN